VLELKEIFIRKEDIERSIFCLRENKDDNLIQDRTKELSDLESILRQLCTELNEEMKNFKQNREKDLLDLMRRFYEEKLKFNTEIKNTNDISVSKE
jgi:hypothetical protein